MTTAPLNQAPPRARRFGVALLYTLFLLGLAETVARAYWRIHYGVPFLDTRRQSDSFYPELTPILLANPSRHDAFVDVLLLGGSTVTAGWGEIPQTLKERLIQTTGRRVRVFTAAFAAHTSLDSYYKYRALESVGFDLVILYDGFNEVRANNIPPALFRDDYSHYASYKMLRDVLDRHSLWPFTLPYTIRYAMRTLQEYRAERAGHPIVVPRHRPDSTMTRHGNVIRSAAPFHRNVLAMIDMARMRGEPFVLMTLAAYFAPGYSEAAFRARRLDYTTHEIATDVWGEPDNVSTGIAAHNSVIHELHATHPEIGFVDMADSIPHQREYFNDVGHLTVRGSERFVEALLPVALRLLDAKFHLDSGGRTLGRAFVPAH